MTLSQRYEIGSLIGRDGDVWLYRARERTTGSAVTLRILAGEVAARPEARLRFLQLAALQARLRHPNIERVLDIGEEAEGPYAAVEEVAGAGLGAVVAARGPLPAAHVADIVRAIADALDYLHDRGLIHGALRPEAVLIDRSGRVVVTGVQDRMVESLAAADEPPSRAADIRAVGAIAHGLLTGSGSAPSSGDAAALDSVRPDLPRTLTAAVQAAMAPAPAQRPSSAGVLARAITAAVAPTPTPLPEGAADLPQSMVSALGGREITKPVAPSSGPPPAGAAVPPRVGAPRDAGQARAPAPAQAPTSRGTGWQAGGATPGPGPAARRPGWPTRDGDAERAVRADGGAGSDRPQAHAEDAVRPTAARPVPPLIAAVVAAGAVIGGALVGVLLTADRTTPAPAGSATSPAATRPPVGTTPPSGAGATTVSPAPAGTPSPTPTRAPATPAGRPAVPTGVPN